MLLGKDRVRLKLLAKEHVLLRRVPMWKIVLAAFCGYKIPVGAEIREGWSGYIEFFVFRCPRCGYFSKDYPHSFPQTRYLTCQHCKMKIPWPKFSAELREFAAIIRFAVRFRMANRLARTDRGRGYGSDGGE